ncbi:adenosylcobinamide-GDP ribazoletransferase [Paenibacillus gansuensis]|uniref:Adenosylcobinamide-GDP ribazoletransferase n=1 Tax=Paenibacillus gansuensis TaxID=306542 RepID=A0ABW5P9C3_9BACL
MNSFWHAVSFLTRFPVPSFGSKEGDWERSPRWYAVVGLLLGAALWGLSFPLEYGLGPMAGAATLLAVWIYMTGALHLDGWMDLADGLGSNRSRERMLEIMKDSRVGAMGVVAAVVLLLLKFTALVMVLSLTGPLQSACLLIVPAAGRFLLAVVIRTVPYISSNGLGQGLREGVTASFLTVQGIGLGGLAYVVSGLGAVPMAAAAAAAAWVLTRKVRSALGGYTGDGYGALVEVTETAALLGLVWMLKFI